MSLDFEFLRKNANNLINRYLEYFFLKSVCLNLLSCTTASDNETSGLGQDINICAAKSKA